jgi:glycosyltransferase involved in cell wall biosynthesis
MLMKLNKIIMVTPHPDSQSGIGTVVKNLLKGDLNEHQNITILPSCVDKSKFGKLVYLWKQYIKYLYLLASSTVNVVHIHTSSRVSFLRKSLFIITAKLFNKKIIIHVHPSHFIDFINSTNIFVRLLIRKILNSARAIIVLTNNVKSELRKYGVEVDIKIVPNPVCLNDFRNINHIIRDDCTLLYLGWIIKEKGVYDLLQVASEMKKELRELKLIYCGNKETEKLRNMVVSMGVDEFVEVREWIDNEQKARLLSKSTALILPSYTEGMPNVILEAMASGLPVLTTPVGGIPEILEDYINCVFIMPGDLEDICSKTIMFLKDNKLRKNIADNNLLKVVQYDSTNIVKQIHSLYEIL